MKYLKEFQDIDAFKVGGNKVATPCVCLTNDDDGNILSYRKDGDSEFVNYQNGEKKEITMGLDYSVLDEQGYAIMDINSKFYATKDDWQAAGSPTVNGIAFSNGSIRLCLSYINMDGYISGFNPRLASYYGGYGIDLSSSGIVVPTQPSNDMDGESNTNKLVAAITESDGYYKESPYSAAGKCKNYTFPNGSQGYLPSYGEWDIVNNILKSNNNASVIFQQVGGDNLDRKYATSTLNELQTPRVYYYSPQYHSYGSYPANELSMIKSCCRI